MKKPALLALGLLTLVSCASVAKIEPSSFRKDGGVHFSIEDKTVTAKHLYDGGAAFHKGEPDIHVRKKITSQRSFTLSERKVKVNDFVLIILPEGNIRARISYIFANSRFVLDSEIPVRPGFSGSPIVLEKTKKVVGVVVGFTEIPGMHIYMHGLGQPLTRELLRIIKKV